MFGSAFWEKQVMDYKSQNSWSCTLQLSNFELVIALQPKADTWKKS